jgi:hypothetical protein
MGMGVGGWLEGGSLRSLVSGWGSLETQSIHLQTVLKTDHSVLSTALVLKWKHEPGPIAWRKLQPKQSTVCAPPVKMARDEKELRGQYH